MRKFKLYPTDLTDKQWKVLQPLIPKAKQRGRPQTDRRKIFSGLLYFVRAGCPWRLLPRDFGPWETLYGCFRTWRQQGLWEKINKELRRLVRREAGRNPQPSAAILDSQSVRSADHSGPRGYDPAKKITGRKRHVLVDTMGLLLAVMVTPANVTDTDGAVDLLAGCFMDWVRLAVIWADSIYRGRFVDWVKALRPRGRLHLEIVSGRPGQKGFVVQPMRWIVERTFGWFMKHRRLVRDYETKPENAVAMIHITMIGIMLRRLA
jgi:putative transposase